MAVGGELNFFECKPMAFMVRRTESMQSMTSKMASKNSNISSLKMRKKISQSLEWYILLKGRGNSLCIHILHSEKILMGFREYMLRPKESGWSKCQVSWLFSRSCQSQWWAKCDDRCRIVGQKQVNCIPHRILSEPEDCQEETEPKRGSIWQLLNVTEMSKLNWMTCLIKLASTYLSHEHGWNAADQTGPH